MNLLESDHLANELNSSFINYYANCVYDFSTVGFVSLL